MRIITGKLKGRNIPTPKTGELRPTSDRTKEGLFSVMAARVYFEGTTVLDLFAGSGNLGFEAISRGSERVLFVDQNPEHIRHVQSLAAEFDIENQILCVVSDVETYLESPGSKYDFVFADPPYDYFNMEQMIDSVMQNGWLKEDGWFILEHDKRHDFSNHKKCVFSKAYGRTIVSIFKETSEGF